MFKALALFCGVVGISYAEVVPEGIPSLAGLVSEKFEEREATQKQLAEWGLKQPETAASRLLVEVKATQEPEIRERCLAVLRTLADQEYQKQGSGYIGIRMQDEKVQVPGKPQPQWGVRVVQVVAGSAAEKAGLQMNDMVVGMEGLAWPAGEASMLFREQVMKLKPGSVLRLDVLRDKQVRRVDVVLGRMPAILKRGVMIGGALEDPAEAERRERDEHYRQWLEKRISEANSP